MKILEDEYNILWIKVTPIKPSDIILLLSWMAIVPMVIVKLCFTPILSNNLVFYTAI